MTKSISLAGGGEAELVLPDFGMYYVDASAAEGGAKSEAQAKEYDRQDALDAYMDAGGHHEVKHMKDYSGYLLGIVVGENPDARMPEYGTSDSHLPRDQRTPVRWSRPAEMPEFGDTVLFRQSVATDYTAFYKLPCDTTPACEFLLCSLDMRRWLRVPRNAEVVSVPIQELWNVVQKFGATVTQPIPV